FFVADVDFASGIDGDEAAKDPRPELTVAGAFGGRLADVPRGGGAKVLFSFGFAFFDLGLVDFAAEHEDELDFFSRDAGRGVELLHAAVAEVAVGDVEVAAGVEGEALGDGQLAAAAAAFAPGFADVA